MHELVNRERERAGLPPLREDPRLCQLALKKAEDMCRYQYFGHYSPVLGNMTELVLRLLPEYCRCGENIALNFTGEEEVHRAWMNSCLHRRNILDGGFSAFGYGWAELGDGQRVYVQVFGG